MPTAQKYWRMGYRFEGTERLLAFGKYPEVTLLEARQKRADARKLLSEGVDPSQEGQSTCRYRKGRAHV